MNTTTRRPLWPAIILATIAAALAIVLAVDRPPPVHAATPGGVFRTPRPLMPENKFRFSYLGENPKQPFIAFVHDPAAPPIVAAPRPATPPTPRIPPPKPATDWPPVELTGPDLADVGDVVTVDVENLTDAQAAAAVVAAWPSSAKVIAARVWSGQNVLLIRPFESGRHTVKLIYPAAAIDPAGDPGPLLVDKIHPLRVAAFTFDAGEPTPPTPPTPPPTPIGNALRVWIFYQAEEFDTAPATQVALIRGAVFRRELEQAGHTVGGFYDVDSITTTTRHAGGLLGRQSTETTTIRPDLADAYAARGATPLPVIVTQPTAGGDYQARPLPTTAADTLALLGKVNR